MSDFYTGLLDLTPVIIVPPPLDVVTPLLRISAIADDGYVRLRWDSSPTVSFIEFELRRGASIIYVGSSHSYIDQDVENGARYQYTVFQSFDDQPTIMASVVARPRRVGVTLTEEEEYIPSRGEFGQRLAYPVSHPTTSVWGTATVNGKSTRDRTIAPAGSMVLAPSDGIVIGLGSHIWIDSLVGGFRFTMGPVVPSPHLHPGSSVRAGEVIARTGSFPFDLSIVKLPVGKYGQRSVRPSYFYLAIEERDGRTKG